MASIKLSSLWDEYACRPCALPITLDVSTSPLVKGLSTTTTSPKRVGEAFAMLASATITAIGFSATRRSCNSNETMPVANAVFSLILDLWKIE
ncbi:hypothetical protein AMTRI_Chr09g21280 [Amborella trichopoda]